MRIEAYKAKIGQISLFREKVDFKACLAKKRQGIDPQSFRKEFGVLKTLAFRIYRRWPAFRPVSKNSFLWLKIRIEQIRRKWLKIHFFDKKSILKHA